MRSFGGKFRLYRRGLRCRRARRNLSCRGRDNGRLVRYMRLARLKKPSDECQRRRRHTRCRNPYEWRAEVGEQGWALRLLNRPQLQIGKAARPACNNVPHQAMVIPRTPPFPDQLQKSIEIKAFTLWMATKIVTQLLLQRRARVLFS